MRIRNLDTFYWIASLGSFRAASEKLHLTQPAISARIQVLEQDLGAEVFVKDVKRAELTVAGRKLFGYAEQLVHLEQGVLSAFTDTANIEQLICIGVSETIALTWLPDFLGYMGQAHGNISYELCVDLSGNLHNALLARKIDLAFSMGPVAEASITSNALCSYDMRFFAAPDIANQRERWSLKDIAKQAVLTFAANTKPSRQLREMLIPLSSGLPMMTTSTSLHAIIRLGVLGMGVCAVPRAVVARELKQGTLIQLQTDATLSAISFTASYVCGSPMSDLMQRIVEQALAFLEARSTKILMKDTK